MHEEKKAGWTIAFSEEDDGVKAWQVRDEIPQDIMTEGFPNCVIVEWRYAEEGPPGQATRNQLYAFGELLNGLDNVAGNSVLVHVIKGNGTCEWCYYARSYDRFMSDLNECLANQPRFPLEIFRDNDPTWRYWRGIKECIGHEG